MDDYTVQRSIADILTGVAGLINELEESTRKQPYYRLLENIITSEMSEKDYRIDIVEEEMTEDVKEFIATVKDTIKESANDMPLFPYQKKPAG